MSGIEFVNVGREGSFHASGNHATSPKDVDDLFESLRSSEAKRLVLHFHGGLVSEAKGVVIARKMAAVYRSDGVHPLTFVWETGLLETLRDNLSSIHRTKLFRKLLKWVLKRTAERFGGLGGRGAGQPIRLSEIEDELDSDCPFAEYDHASTGRGAARGAPPATTEGDLAGLEDELLAEFEEDVAYDEEIERLLEDGRDDTVDPGARGFFSGVKIAKSLAAVAYRVIKRHVRRRDHGFYPTVVEELLRELYLADLGAWVWARMKDKAAAMWGPNAGRSGEDLRVGTYVLEKIAALQSERSDFAVDLVGHSAGAIAICRLLAAVAERNLGVSVRRIAFLAPAGRSELGLEEVARHPGRYEDFRVYTMADSYEREDQLVPKIYTRSLLYFISGVLEPDEVDAPIMGLERHGDGQAPYDSGSAKEWGVFMRTDNRLVLADSRELDPVAPPGLQSSARRHGDFDDDKLTQASLVNFLS